MIVYQSFQQLFQSTSSVRRTTRFWRRARIRTRYFNPRPPRGGRLRQHLGVCPWCEFQSTSSARRTTQKSFNENDMLSISIHVLREEDDPHVRPLARLHNISIHVLREEDDIKISCLSGMMSEFQSTSSARRTTRLAFL